MEIGTAREIVVAGDFNANTVKNKSHYTYGEDTPNNNFIFNNLTI